MDNNVEGGIHRPPRFCTLASAPAAAGVAAPAAVGVAPAAVVSRFFRTLVCKLWHE